MKQRSRAYKSYPDWRQREARMFMWAIAVGGVAAVGTGIIIWFVNHHSPY